MIQSGYILLTILMYAILVFGYNYALGKANVANDTRKKNVFTLAIGLLIWFIYAFIIGKSGVLRNFDLPPRFPLLTILPAFTMIGIFLYKHKDSPILKTIPKSGLIYYQSFRIIVESLFVATVGLGILHPEVTFEGYNYDIVFAFTAPIIAFLVFNKKVLPQKVALYWNYLGLVVIAFIIYLFTTTVYFPSIWGSTETLANEQFIDFPYVLVPAFLMPSAVFIHLLSIMQLRKYPS
ncbi:MAG: hypothetical protein ACPG5B_02015 [Chitinophagales bacterium]